MDGSVFPVWGEIMLRPVIAVANIMQHDLVAFRSAQPVFTTSGCHGRSSLGLIVSHQAGNDNEGEKQAKLRSPAPMTENQGQERYGREGEREGMTPSCGDRKIKPKGAERPGQANEEKDPA